MGRSTAALEAGDTLCVRLSGLDAATPYDLVLRDKHDRMLGFARAAAARDGTLGPEVLWYESGVAGPDPAGNGNQGHGFATFDEAAAFLATEPIRVEVRLAALANPGDGQLVLTQDVPVHSPRTTPLLWFSGSQGKYRTSFDANADTIHVSGSNFPAGSTIELYVVADRTQWEVGDEIVDVTGWNASSHRKKVNLAQNQTDFTVPVWTSGMQRAGHFDLIARIVNGPSEQKPRLRADDLVSFGLETGVEIRKSASISSGQDIVAPLAGQVSRKGLYPGFEFINVFVRHSTVKLALDPSDVPPNHPGGDFAALYVVADKDRSQWRTNPALHDITETVEFRPMKPGTLAFTIGDVWTDPDPQGQDFFKADLVCDFLPARTTGPGFLSTVNPAALTIALSNGQYDVGVDVNDSLGDAGLTIVNDPSEPGPFAVGRTSYDFPDAYDIPWGQYADKNVDVRAVVAYPAQTAGTDTPIHRGTAKYPLIAILHGNHIICLTGGGCDHHCPLNKRVPNDAGYDYLLDLWASHGFIAVSIDGFDVTCNDDRFVERAALILEHLRYWENWNDPTIADPTFNGRFWNRVDTTKEGIAGHSRGGEGAAGAVQMNQDIPLNHQIAAVVTIAPTDFNSYPPPGNGPTAFVVKDTPLFNIMGSSDGDVWDNEGAQTFDRAEPPNHRAAKAQAYIYGADHNNWNTIWIDPSWGGSDDGVGANRITAQQQQDTASVYVTAWFQAFLQGHHEMLEFAKNRAESVKLDKIVSTYWSFESATRLDVDHFEDTPKDPNFNSLGGSVIASPPPAIYLESSFTPGSYDGSLYQDTKGLIVGWTQQTTYESDIPIANQDVSPYTHFAIRVAQFEDNHTKNTGGPQHFLVNLEDANGRRQAVDLHSDAFDPIPYPYKNPIGGFKTMLATVRVPLRSFTQDGSGLDLTQIRKVIITFENTGLLAIDDIGFSK